MAKRNSDPEDSEYGSSRVDAIDAFEKAVAAEAAFDGVDKRLDKFDKRFDKLDSNFEGLRKEFHEFSRTFASFSTGVEKDDTSQLSIASANRERLKEQGNRLTKVERNLAIILAVAAIIHPLLLIGASAWFNSQFTVVP